MSLLGKTFEKISQVHGHNAYKSNDEVYTLCFSLGDLVGGGQWIVKVGVLLSLKFKSYSRKDFRGFFPRISEVFNFVFVQIVIFK